LPTCTNCGGKFNWIQVQKNVWGLIGYLKKVSCKKCGSEYQVSYSSGVLTNLLLILPPLLYGMFLTTYSFRITALIQLSMLFVISLFIPFIIRYDSLNR
jgi:CXXC-20-CXXC protein